MTRRSVAARVVRVGVGLTVLVGGLAGCSDDPLDAYCAEVQAQQKPLTEAAAAGSTGLIDALPSFEDRKSVV